MANERITEDIVRNHFKSDPLFKSVKFEEQKSYNKRVIDLLQTASKSGKGVGNLWKIISKVYLIQNQYKNVSRIYIYG